MEMKDQLEDSIANYDNKEYNFNGERGFDLHQARSSGVNTSASTRA